jgi:hypothetical protein
VTTGPAATHVTAAASMASAATAVTVRKSNRGQHCDCQGNDEPTHQGLLWLIYLMNTPAGPILRSSRGLDRPPPALRAGGQSLSINIIGSFWRE